MKRIVLATSLLLVSSFSLATPEAPLAFKKAVCGYEGGKHIFEDVLKTGALYRMSEKLFLDSGIYATYCYYYGGVDKKWGAGQATFRKVYYWVDEKYRPY